MNSIDRLAQKLAEMHKGNRNPPSTAPRIGSVIGTDPLKISWGDHIVITDDKLFIPKIYRSGRMIPNRYQTLNGGMVEETLLWKIEINVGDRVMIMPDEDFKTWYILEVL